jgi:hypothetical protein
MKSMGIAIGSTEFRTVASTVCHLAVDVVIAVAGAVYTYQSFSAGRSAGDAAIGIGATALGVGLTVLTLYRWRRRHTRTAQHD